MGIGKLYPSFADSREMRELVDEKIIRIISPADTVQEYGEFMFEALKEDKQDEDFMKDIKNRDPWLLYGEKVPEQILNYSELNVYRTGNNQFVLPFEVGESIMISHALYASLSKEKEGEFLHLLTDAPIHRDLLKCRIKRGKKNAESKIQQIGTPSVERAWEIVKMPELNINVKQFLRKREENIESFKNIKSCIRELINLIEQPPSEGYERKRMELKKEVYLEYENMEFIPRNTIKYYSSTDTDTDYTSLSVGRRGLAIGTLNSKVNGIITEANGKVSEYILSHYNGDDLAKAESTFQTVLTP